MRWYFGQFDIWSGWHFFGSFFLAHLLILFFGFWGIPIAFGLGILWEIIFDGILNNFDRKGGSWSDIICDLFGVSSAVFI